MKGLFKPVFKEVELGRISVRNTFKVSGVGTIAGAYVQDGKVSRNAQVRVVRDGRYARILHFAHYFAYGLFDLFVYPVVSDIWHFVLRSGPFALWAARPLSFPFIPFSRYQRFTSSITKASIVSPS